VTSVRPEVVIHLSGVVPGDRSLEAVAPTLRANLLASVELLEAGTRVGCRRIVLSGSFLEEPAAGSPQTVRPHPTAPPGGPRAHTDACFTPVRRAGGDSPPLIRLRAGQEQTKLIHHVISGLLDGGSPELNSDERLLECVYAEDVARAYVEAAAASGEGRTIDSGRGVLTSVREIVQLIVESRRPVSGTSSTQHASSQELKVGCGGGHYRRRHSTQWLGGPTASPVGAWTHVALTYDGATLRLLSTATRSPPPP
jgi:nucleoside-diphosphate-sugar epimerase